jgi:hypothetical protein
MPNGSIRDFEGSWAAGVVDILSRTSPRQQPTTTSQVHKMDCDQSEPTVQLQCFTTAGGRPLAVSAAGFATGQRLAATFTRLAEEQVEFVYQGAPEEEDISRLEQWDHTNKAEEHKLDLRAESAPPGAQNASRRVVALLPSIPENHDE